MNSEMMAVALGVGVFFLLHIVVWRATPSYHPRMWLLALLAMNGLLISVLTCLVLAPWDGRRLFGVIWMDVFLFLLYFFTYAGLIRSVSITLLGRLLAGGNKPESFQVLFEEYSASERFEDRLRVLDKSGLLRLEGSYVILTSKGTRWARWTTILSQIAGVGLRG